MPLRPYLILIGAVLGAAALSLWLGLMAAPLVPEWLAGLGLIIAMAIAVAVRLWTR